jgi:hypothetical protein
LGEHFARSMRLETWSDAHSRWPRLEATSQFGHKLSFVKVGFRVGYRPQFSERMLMSSFVATVGSAEELEDLDTFVVVLSEMPDGDGARFEIQRGLTVDPQDEALGQDTYCLCTQTGATHYGGVQSWRVDDGVLMISLDELAALTLGVDRQVSIELRLGEQALGAVTAGVARALEIPRSE